MVETTLPDGLETSVRRVYRLFWHISRRFLSFCVLDDFFCLKKNRFLGILGPPGNNASRWLDKLHSEILSPPNFNAIYDLFPAIGGH